MPNYHFSNLTSLISVPAVFTNIAQQAGYRSRGSVQSDAKWRRENNLPSCPSSFGPLTNLPDYTFEDGRPTPLGVSSH